MLYPLPLHLEQTSNNTGDAIMHCATPEHQCQSLFEALWLLLHIEPTKDVQGTAM